MQDNEWYTPSPLIEAARSVMGSIDLDPASCEEANRVVRAERYYTKEENGLMQPWYGRIWCNPPYGHTNGRCGNNMSHQKAFALKLLYEYQVGNVEEAVLLSLGNPNSLWFQPFYDFPVCQYRGYITFTRVNGNRGHFGFPLALVYLGRKYDRFITTFSPFGRVVSAIDNGVPRVINLELWKHDRL